MEDQDYYYSNYTILNHILDEDIAQIEKNIRRLQVLNQDGIDENLSKKYIYLAGLNKSARDEICNFKENSFQSFLEEKRNIDYAGRTEDECLIMMFRSNYQYGIYSKYYNPDYDFSTETKIRGFSISLLEVEEIISDAIKMHQENPDEYYSMMKDKIKKNRLLEKNALLVDAHNVLVRRTEIFKDLVDLYSSERWKSFIALAVLQIEGLFYDCCEILKERNLSGTAGCLPEKVEKAFSENVALMHYAYPYFRYEVPLLRNKIAHVGTIEASEKELKHICIDLILDINAVVDWVYKLSRDKYTVIEMIYNEVKENETKEDATRDLLASMLSCMTVSDFKYLDVLIDYTKFEKEFRYMKLEENFFAAHVSYLRKIIDTENFWNILAGYIDENKKCEDKPYSIEWLAGKLADAFIKLYPKDSAEKSACIKVMAKVNICKKIISV